MSNDHRIKLYSVARKLLLAMACLLLVLAAFVSMLMHHGQKTEWRLEERRKAVMDCRTLVVDAQKQRLETVIVPSRQLDRAVFHAGSMDAQNVVLTRWFYVLSALLGAQSAGFILWNLFSPSKKTQP